MRTETHFSFWGKLERYQNPGNQNCHFVSEIRVGTFGAATVDILCGELPRVQHILPSHGNTTDPSFCILRRGPLQLQFILDCSRLYIFHLHHCMHLVCR